MYFLTGLCLLKWKISLVTLNCGHLSLGSVPRFSDESFKWTSSKCKNFQCWCHAAVERNLESFYCGSFPYSYSSDLVKLSWLSEWTGGPTKCGCETSNRKWGKESSVLPCCGVLLFVTLVCIFLSAASHVPRDSEQTIYTQVFPLSVT